MLDTLLLILHINKLHKCICYSAVQGCHKYATKKYGWMILILIQYFPILNLSIYLVSVKKIFKSRIFIRSQIFFKSQFFQVKSFSKVKKFSRSKKFQSKKIQLKNFQLKNFQLKNFRLKKFKVEKFSRSKLFHNRKSFQS